MRYIATRDLHCNGKVYAGDDPITLGDDANDIAEQLLGIGAIRLPSRGDVETPLKPLAKMTRAELDAIVAAEAVDIAGATTNADIIKAIEAARAAGAQG